MFKLRAGKPPPRLSRHHLSLFLEGIVVALRPLVKPKTIKKRTKKFTQHQTSPELASNTTEFLQARRLQLLETAPLSSTAAFSSEPLEPLSTRLPPRAQIPGLRPHQDPHKTGLRHYVKLFSFCTKMPMENKALEMVEECLDKYFQHLYEDLEVFAMHVGCKTMRPEDLEHLMQRQGLVDDQVSLYVLVERHLPLEYWPLFIPCAFTGNSVFPAQQWPGLNTHPVPTCGHLAPPLTLPRASFCLTSAFQSPVWHCHGSWPLSFRGTERCGPLIAGAQPSGWTCGGTRVPTVPQPSGDRALNAGIFRIRAAG
ncbi:centromere protein T-like [Callorhinus ursinus]|uniref:Centromere protein T-like n=1 Tax=Callorhinus ursinus TaxID=34884 RepID=A0A3Q7MP73_CALUR|nr:centromere protein T-like [Callorhinus ursinus]